MKNKIWRIVFSLSLVVFIGCIVVFGYQFYMNYQSDNDIHKYEKTTVSTVKNEVLENPIDFKGLQKKNSDIYGWIRIDNTNIDYPILQASNGDNQYYLRKNIYKEYNNNGVIFTENYNNTDFNDPVTVVYGHNIWTAGKMFFQLHKFENKSFFENNPNFYIYTKGHSLKYEIYSAFEYDDRHIMQSFDFSNKKVFQEFIDYTKDPASMVKNIRKSTKVSADDKIVVLSTCIKSQDDMRYLVIGVLTKDEKTK